MIRKVCTAAMFALAAGRERAVRHSSISLFIALSVLLVLLTACGEKSTDPATPASQATDPATPASADPATPAADNQTPQTDAESEQLAIEATGALTAPQLVNERVFAELQLIRTIQPAVTNIKARPSWVLQEMLIAFDDAGWAAVQEGTYTAWNDLNSTYGVTKIEASIPASRKSVILTFAGRYNIPLLAPEYAKLPNVRFAEQNGVMGDGPDVCMAIGDGDDHFFIFDAASGFDCPAGCTENVYWGFAAAPDGGITGLGTWDDNTAAVEPAWLSDPLAPACTKWLGYGHTFGTSGTLSGTVIFWEGNFMPGNSTGTKTPVVRDILIYEPTSIYEVSQAHVVPDPFYADIQTKLVATTTSDTNGHFSLSLPAGRYSLFVKEDGLFYSNSFESNIIDPVTVTTGETTTVEFDITYQAAF